MNTTLLIIVLVLGILLLALEIIALPGGIAGIFGIILIGFGVWQTYALFGNTTGTIVLLCAIALCVLNEEVTSRVNEIESAVKVGSRGTTISRLAPTGKALIDGQPTEVHAVNKFIDPDHPVEVVAIEGYRIDVVEISDDRFKENQ